MSVEQGAARPPSRDGAPRRLSDPKTRALLAQALLLVALLALVAWAAFNLRANLVARGLQFGFDYLWRPAGFEIGESLIPYAPSNSYGWALLAGLANTIRIALFAIVLSTLIGAALGMLRLAPNPLLSGLVGVYVETIRNTPLVLQLVLWYAIINALPGPRAALSPVPGVYLSNRGLQIPWFDGAGLGLVLVAALAGALLTLALHIVLRRREGWTGRARWPWALCLTLGAPLLTAWSAGWPVTVSVPHLAGFTFRGGITLTPEFAALQFGLILYGAAFTAEIVRGGVLSVAQGQWEAGRSLGMPDRRIMRLVVFPQALRVIVPPLTSNLLSLTKNSSLAVVIGYPDLVHVSNTTMNQTGRAMEAIIIFALVYLSLSLATAALMNWYNARVAIKER